MQNIERQFADVGLRCRLQKRPIVRTNPDIFQMDIQERRGKETFLIWPGHEVNQVHILGQDKSFQQIVMFVKEPSREFEMTEGLGLRVLQKNKSINEVVTNWQNHAGVPTRDIVSVDPQRLRVTYRRRTPEGKRHFLTGMDECHYFMTQLREPVQTIRQAHDSLRAMGIERNGDFKRQGEWFFVREEPDSFLMKTGIIRKKHHIGARGGNPHVADELLLLADGSVFVRGKVRHVDHKTKKFSQWMRVRGNTETSVSRGATWID